MEQSKKKTYDDVLTDTVSPLLPSLENLEKAAVTEESERLKKFVVHFEQVLAEKILVDCTSIIPMKMKFHPECVLEALLRYFKSIHYVMNVVPFDKKKDNAGFESQEATTRRRVSEYEGALVPFEVSPCFDDPPPENGHRDAYKYYLVAKRVNELLLKAVTEEFNQFITATPVLLKQEKFDMESKYAKDVKKSRYVQHAFMLYVRKLGYQLNTYYTMADPYPHLFRFSELSLNGRNESSKKRTEFWDKTFQAYEEKKRVKLDDVAPVPLQVEPTKVEGAKVEPAKVEAKVEQRYRSILFVFPQVLRVFDEEIGEFEVQLLHKRTGALVDSQGVYMGSEEGESKYTSLSFPITNFFGDRYTSFEEDACTSEAKKKLLEKSMRACFRWRIVSLPKKIVIYNERKVEKVIGVAPYVTIVEKTGDLSAYPPFVQKRLAKKTTPEEEYGCEAFEQEEDFVMRLLGRPISEYYWLTDMQKAIGRDFYAKKKSNGVIFKSETAHFLMCMQKAAEEEALTTLRAQEIKEFKAFAKAYDPDILPSHPPPPPPQPPAGYTRVRPGPIVAQAMAEEATAMKEAAKAKEAKTEEQVEQVRVQMQEMELPDEFEVVDAPDSDSLQSADSAESEQGSKEGSKNARVTTQYCTNSAECQHTVCGNCGPMCTGDHHPRCKETKKNETASYSKVFFWNKRKCYAKVCCVQADISKDKWCIECTKVMCPACLGNGCDKCGAYTCADHRNTHRCSDRKPQEPQKVESDTSSTAAQAEQETKTCDGQYTEYTCDGKLRYPLCMNPTFLKCGCGLQWCSRHTVHCKGCNIFICPECPHPRCDSCGICKGQHMPSCKAPEKGDKLVKYRKMQDDSCSQAYIERQMVRDGVDPSLLFGNSKLPKGCDWMETMDSNKCGSTPIFKCVECNRKFCAEHRYVCTVCNDTVCSMHPHDSCPDCAACYGAHNWWCKSKVSKQGTPELAPLPKVSERPPCCGMYDAKTAPACGHCGEKQCSRHMRTCQDCELLTCINAAVCKDFPCKNPKVSCGKCKNKLLPSDQILTCEVCSISLCGGHTYICGCGSELCHDHLDVSKHTCNKRYGNA